MPYFRLSSLYFFYYGIFGVLAPYLGRYLKAYDFDFKQIGMVMAVITGVNIIAPFVIARISDRTGKRMGLARFAVIFMVITILILEPQWGFWITLALFGIFGAAMSMVVPQMEAVTMANLGENRHRYAQIRLWGGIGFIFVVSAMSPVLEILGVEWFRWSLVILSLGLLLCTYLVPDQNINTSESHEAVSTDSSGLEKLGNPVVLVMLIVMCLNQAGLAPYNTFVDLYLQENGYLPSQTGMIIALAVVAEVLVMAITPYLLSRISYFPLLLGSLILTLVRWVIMAFFVQHTWLLAFGQIIHAFNFGIIHSVAIYLVVNLFTERQQGMGQSLYVSFGMGLGLVSGNLMAGWMWDIGAHLMFIAAAAIAAATLLLSVWKLRPSQTGC